MGDKNQKNNNRSVLGTMLYVFIVVVLPVSLIVHSIYLFASAQNGGIFDHAGYSIGLGICELVAGLFLSFFWGKHYLSAKKEEKFRRKIVKTGQCLDCQILGYSKERNRYDYNTADGSWFPEAVVIRVSNQIYVLHVNNILVPQKFPVNSHHLFYMSTEENKKHILVVNYNDAKLVNYIDNSLELSRGMIEKYMKIYQHSPK